MYSKTVVKISQIRHCIGVQTWRISHFLRDFVSVDLVPFLNSVQLGGATILMFSQLDF